MNFKTVTKYMRQMVLNQENKFPTEGPLSYSHIIWMLNEIDNFATPENNDKANRWVGWAQCAIVSAGCYNLDDMKKINSSVIIKTI